VPSTGAGVLALRNGLDRGGGLAGVSIVVSKLSQQKGVGFNPVDHAVFVGDAP
jgi:hypothetical protein